MRRQINAQRLACSRAGPVAIEVPAFFIGGEGPSGSLPVVLRRLENVQSTAHTMVQRGPLRCRQVVVHVLAAS